MVNLALADLSMGLYLFLIVGMDVNTIGVYFNYAIDWQNGTFWLSIVRRTLEKPGHLSEHLDDVNKSVNQLRSVAEKLAILQTHLYSQFH